MTNLRDILTEKMNSVEVFDTLSNDPSFVRFDSQDVPLVYNLGNSHRIDRCIHLPLSPEYSDTYKRLHSWKAWPSFIESAVFSAYLKNNFDALYQQKTSNPFIAPFFVYEKSGASIAAPEPSAPIWGKNQHHWIRKYLNRQRSRNVLITPDSEIFKQIVIAQAEFWKAEQQYLGESKLPPSEYLSDGLIHVFDLFDQCRSKPEQFRRPW